MANRAELEQALKEGCTVDVGGRSCRNVKELPPDPATGGELTGTVTYDPEGRLTREGMELALSRGGSVLHQGEPVTNLEALPTAADLAKHDQARAAAVRQSLMADRARIDAEMAKLEQPREERFTQAHAQQEQPPREEPHPQRPAAQQQPPARAEGPFGQRPSEGQDTGEGRRGKKGG